MLEVAMNKLPVSALASGVLVTLTILLGVQVFGVFVLLSFLRSGVIRWQINPAIEVVNKEAISIREQTKSCKEVFGYMLAGLINWGSNMTRHAL